MKPQATEIMGRSIRSIQDAYAVVRDAGLSGPWYPAGTAVGFGDWLYLNRWYADPRRIRGEVDEYLRRWLGAFDDGWDLDADSRSDVERDVQAVAHLARAGRDMADAVATARLSISGRRALSGLSWLATTAGRSLGPRKQDVASLEALSALLEQLKEISEVVPLGWLESYRDLYESPQDGRRRYFAHLEQHLRDSPPHNVEVPHIAVALTVALARNSSVHAAVHAELNAAQMRHHIGRAPAPASSRPSPRSLRTV